MLKAVGYLARLCLLMLLTIGLGTLIPRPFFAERVGVVADPAHAALPGPAGAGQTVFLVSSPIHTDLALPLSPDLAKRFGFLTADGLDPSQPGVSYIIAGWGGRSFYIETPTWSDLKPGPLFRALTIDRAVMHVGLAGAIDPAHPTVMAINLDGTAYECLVDAVLADFTGIKAAGPMVVAGVAYGDYDLFYEAEGWFNAAIGYNLWTARMLREAGLQTGWWTPVPSLLAASLRLHNPTDRFSYNPVAR
ncbi:TIGR02117 family protein [Hoeflea sp.]|uniref:TIGR02117 family protein n=1 Tax=Hoeflea sp. TaxID=1940281 RepID=UPI003A9524FE